MWQALRRGSGKAGLIAAAACVLLLLLWPGLPDMRANTGSTELERRLAEVLSCLAGAGEVRVFVYTAGAEEEAVYAFASVERNDAIIGVIVVAEGAASAAVASRLAQATAVALGVEQTCVEVFPMEKEEYP